MDAVVKKVYICRCSLTEIRLPMEADFTSKKPSLFSYNSLIVNHKANNNIHISNPHHSRNRSFIVIVA